MESWSPDEHSLLIVVGSRRFLVYCVKQLAEASALVFDLIMRQRTRLRTQRIDDNLPFHCQIDRIDYAAQRSAGVLLAHLPVTIIKEAECTDVAQPRYPVSPPSGEIVLLITTPLQPRDVCLAELHFRLLATLLTMRAAHRTSEVRRIVKAWGQRLLSRWRNSHQ